jgi:hypothetical protein
MINLRGNGARGPYEDLEIDQSKLGLEHEPRGRFERQILG